jgi:hypothetical protein
VEKVEEVEEGKQEVDVTYIKPPERVWGKAEKPRFG